MSDVAVIGIPDLVSGELPKAFVVRRGDITSEELKQFVASKVPPEKKLRGGVEFVEKIPKSASGKILRRLLRKQEQQKSRLWLPELSTLLSVKLIDVSGGLREQPGRSESDWQPRVGSLALFRSMKFLVVIYTIWLMLYMISLFIYVHFV